jgi:hypothetical protein
MIVENNGKATTAVGGVTGIGFRPGQSGNPGGRPKVLAALVREATNDGQNPVDFLVKVFEGKVKGVRVADRLAAAREWLDRGHGKAAQQVDAQVSVDARSLNINADFRPLMALIARLRLNKEQLDEFEAMLLEQKALEEGKG